MGLEVRGRARDQIRNLYVFLDLPWERKWIRTVPRSICYSQGLYSQNILGLKVAPNLVIYEKLLKNNGLVSLNFFGRLKISYCLCR